MRTKVRTKVMRIRIKMRIKLSQKLLKKKKMTGKRSRKIKRTKVSMLKNLPKSLISQSKRQKTYWLYVRGSSPRYRSIYTIETIVSRQRRMV